MFSHLIERLKKACSVIIAENVDEIKRWNSEIDMVIPSAFAANNFPDQPKFTGDATLFDLALIWGKERAVTCLAQKEFYISYTVLNHIINASSAQIQ